MKVTSLAEVWIEIFVVRMHRYIMQSLPLRKCGLKFIFIAIPHFRDTVTSLAEVWIEIFVVRMHRYIMQSLPLRKCGLKLCFAVLIQTVI